MDWKRQNNTVSPMTNTFADSTATVEETFGKYGAQTPLNHSVHMHSSLFYVKVDRVTQLTVPTPDLETETQTLYPVEPGELYGRSVTIPNKIFGNIEKLETISKLQNDWNGEGAKAFHSSLINKVKGLLINLKAQPEIFPTAENSIQFEFDGDNNSYLEIEFSDADVAKVYRIDKDGSEHYDIVNFNAAAVAELVNAFYG